MFSLWLLGWKACKLLNAHSALEDWCCFVIWHVTDVSHTCKWRRRLRSLYGKYRRRIEIFSFAFCTFCRMASLAVRFWEGKRDKEFHPVHAVVGTPWKLKQWSRSREDMSALSFCDITSWYDMEICTMTWYGGHCVMWHRGLRIPTSCGSWSPWSWWSPDWAHGEIYVYNVYICDVPSLPAFRQGFGGLVLWDVSYFNGTSRSNSEFAARDRISMLRCY